MRRREAEILAGEIWSSGGGLQDSEWPSWLCLVIIIGLGVAQILSGGKKHVVDKRRSWNSSPAPKNVR